MNTVKEIRDRQLSLTEEARKKLNEITDDTSEARQAEIEIEYDRIMADYDKLEARAVREEALEQRQAALYAPDERRPVGEARSLSTLAKRTITPETAFRSYLLNGTQGITAEERNMLIESRAQSLTNSAGGFTVPVGFANELVKSLKMWGPMLDPGVTRELVTASGNTLHFPTNDDTASVATIIGENVEVNPGTNAPGDLVFGQKSLGAFKYNTGMIKVSMELAQDSAFNMEAVIRDAMAERLGRGVNAHLTTGAGTTVPWGIVTRSVEGHEPALSVAGTSGVPVLRFDDMIDLFHSVDPSYRSDPSAAWMFNDATLKVLRKIKDDEDNYIWQPASVAGDVPATILGKRYVINQAMPSLAFDAKPVIFGAMNRYIVRRVAEFSVARLSERFAEFGQLAFIGFARFDGELLDTAAVKHIVIPSDPS